MSHQFLLSTATKVPYIITPYRCLLVLNYAIRVPCHTIRDPRAPERHCSVLDQKLIQDFGPIALHAFDSPKSFIRYRHVPALGTARSGAPLRRRTGFYAEPDWQSLCECNGHAGAVGGLSTRVPNERPFERGLLSGPRWGDKPPRAPTSVALCAGLRGHSARVGLGAAPPHAPRPRRPPQ